MHFQVTAFMWFYNLALKEKEEKFRNLGFQEVIGSGSVTPERGEECGEEPPQVPIRDRGQPSQQPWKSRRKKANLVKPSDVSQE